MPDRDPGPLAAGLRAVEQELRRRWRAGETVVAVEESTLEAVRAAVRTAAAGAPEVAVDPEVREVAEGTPAGAGAAAGPAPGGAAADPAPEPPSSPVPAPPPAAAPAAGVLLPEPEPFVLPAGTKPERWEWLRQRVQEDPVCRAHVRPGKQVVLGVGSLDAAILFVGEAPGAEEEIRGEPFVGPAGQLLDRMIQAMGLRRADVYIGNIMNWRPQMPTLPGREQVGNRPPDGAEMAYCLPYLRAQVEIVQPRAIVALGKTATDGLLGPGTVRVLGAARGRWHEFGGIPLMVTFHPSYLLRNQTKAMKRTAWEDLMLVMERVGLPISEKQRGYFL